MDFLKLNALKLMQAKSFCLRFKLIIFQVKIG